MDVKLEQIDKDIESLLANKKERLAEIEAEKKPKLRHGETALFKCNDGYEAYGVYIDSDALKDTVVFPNETYAQPAPKVKHGVHGSLAEYFDDLKALSEDVTEFEYDNTTFKLRGSRELELTMHGKTSGNLWCLVLSDGLILKLRQMQATIRRKNER